MLQLRLSLHLLLLTAAPVQVGLTALDAHAQTAAAVSPAALVDARPQHEQGVLAFARGRFDDAIAAFQVADRLLPDAALSYNIAKAYEGLHDYDRALAYYREYLRRAPLAPDRGAVETRVSELTRQQREQQSQRVELQTHPRGAIVWLDDEPVGSSPVALTLPPGKHRATFRLKGHRPQELSFELSVGAAPLHVHATLEPVHGDDEAKASARAKPVQELEDPFAAPSGSVKAAHPDKPRTLMRDLGFTAMLASVAVLGTAIAFEAMRSDAEQRARQETEQVRFAQGIENMQTKQTLARVFAGAGGGLAALGVTLLVISGKKAGERETARVALHCAPNKCRAELSGRF